MIKYDISTHNYVGSGPTIVALENGAEIPAVIISQLDRDFPFETDMIARNFRYLVNGHDPIETTAFRGRTVHYQGLRGAIMLRFQEDGGGMTKGGLMLTINRAAPEHIVTDLEDKMDADFVGKLCGTLVVPMPTTPAPTTQQTLSR